MSQPRLVARVKTRNRWRFSATGAPGDEGELAAHPGGERPEREVEQQAVRQPGDGAVGGEEERPRRGRAAAAAAPPPSRPRRRRASGTAATGPTPPVTSADANSVVAPSTKPNPAPKTRPPRTSRKKTVSRPAVPAPSGRSAAPTAASTPSIATRLDVHAALADLGEDDGEQQRQHEREDERVRRCRGPAPTRATRASGQQKATQPGRPTTSGDGGRATAGAARSARRRERLTTASPRGPRRTSPTVSHGPGAVTLATCGAKAGDDTTTSAVGPSATTSPGRHDDHPVGALGDELDVVGGHDDRPTARGEPAQHAGSAPALAVGSRPRVGSSSSSTGGSAVSWTASTSASFCPSDRSRGWRSRGMPGATRSSSAGAGAARARRSRGRPGRTPRRRCRGRAGRPRSAGPARPVSAVLPQRGRAARRRRMPRHRSAAVGRVTRTVPEVSGPLPWSAHSRDDLPEPLRPMRAVTSPARRSRSTPATASTSPGWRTTTPRAATSATSRRRSTWRALDGDRPVGDPRSTPGRGSRRGGRAGRRRPARVAHRQRQRRPPGIPAELDDGRGDVAVDHEVGRRRPSATAPDGETCTTVSA